MDVFRVQRAILSDTGQGKTDLFLYLNLVWSTMLGYIIPDVIGHHNIYLA